MAENIFNDTVQSLMDGMNGMLSTKTVVGEAIHIGETIILPLVDVSFGVGAGMFQNNEKNNGGGGLGGKMSPSAVLVVQGSTTRLISVKEQDGITKLIDMIPDFVEKFVPKNEKNTNTAKKQAAQEMEDMLDDAVENLS